MRQAVLTLVFLFNLLIFNTLSAQTTAKHLPGDLLVSLRPGASPERLAERLNQIWPNQPINLVVVKKVANPMNIWLLHSDLEGENDELRMLEIVRRQSGVAVAQFNHVVENRSHFDPTEFSKEMEAAQNELSSKRKKAAKMLSTLPNDPQFGQQWQYINDGSSGGTVDADTDIELAWDVTTGGLTPDGDTIVVCVVDGGVNINHPDFGNNIWKNYAEIPGNGIDDDGNGYKDDFRGWSSYTNSDIITTNAGHGTCVAGIVGAKGNNGIGVSGVNWNVKIMVVAGGGAEANVLASYAYPYYFRKKYNETGGQKGAFVVATNSSWGTDLGQPADAPLWCAFYDTLGKVGILSCGATANANYNIDTQGDLPTACPSDYLIAVTNCGRNGKKVTSAGYGATTIDLGSFGENAWTLSQTGYAAFGGTSGATPHVTGTIGLLYSAPCPGFIALAKTDPAQAALNLKKYILDGVDPEPTLQNGKTATGGRLNIDHAMQNLLTNCSSCPTPFSITATGVTQTEASISFQKIDPVAVVNLRYQIAGSGTWTVKNAAISPVLLENLVPCTSYEVETEMVCADSTSGWSAVKTFKTDGCCDPVANLAATNLTNSSATISWSPVTAATGYHIQIGIPGIPVLYDIPNYQPTTFQLTDAQPCLEFTVTVSTLCAGGQEIPAAPIFFKTKGCGTCEDGAYCANSGGAAAEEWIESVEFSDLLHQNVTNSPGYVLTGESATVEQFHVYPIKLTPGFPAGAFNEYFRAWIDWDQNGIFDDPGERVFDSGAAAQGTVSTDVLVGNVQPGTARLRVAMKYTGVNGSKPLPCATFQYGQVKDFCVDIKPGQPDCAPPATVSLVAATDTTATIKWDAIPFATEYFVKINKKGETAFQEFTVTTNQVLLKDLVTCTEYEAHVRPKCGTVDQPAETYFLFKTSCGVATGNLPELAGIFIAPNPFSEKLTVSLFSEKTGEASLEMFSTNGQLVDNQQVRFHSGENQFSMKTEKLASGVYFIKIKTTDGVAVRRVVKG